MPLPHPGGGLPPPAGDVAHRDPPDDLHGPTVRARDQDVEAEHSPFIRKRNDAAAVGFTGPGRDGDFAPIEPHGKGDDAAVPLPPGAGRVEGRVEGKGGAQGSDRLRVLPPGDLRRRPGRREANVAQHVPVGGPEGDELVIQTPGGNGEDRPLRRGLGEGRQQLHPLPRRISPTFGQEENRRMLDLARPLRLPAGYHGQQSGAAAAVGGSG